MSVRAAAVEEEIQDLGPAPITVLQADNQGRGEIDMQISTAKRFPRDIARCLREIETLATMSADIAEQCFYKLKRRGGDGDRAIEGPSVRFAEIVAQSWGNLRAEARTVDEDARFVYAHGTAWDLEKNTAIRFGVRRRITTRNGTTYSDDMIATTANAAGAIALRNALFRVVPKAFWEPILDKVKAVAVGDAKTLGERRQKALDYFTQKLGISAERVFAYLGVTGIEAVSLKHVEDLTGLKTALKDGDAKLDEVFPEPAKTGSTDAEIDRLMTDLPESVKASAIVAFDALSLTPGQRLVHLRQFAGKPEELDTTLGRLMSTQPEPPL